MAMRINPFGCPEEKGWRVLESETVLDNPWFGILRSQVTTPAGREVTYHTIDYHQKAVGVIPRRPGEILLIRQYRFIVDQFVWAIPSGGVEAGEEPAFAAGRELLEETGYRAEQVTPLHSYYPSYGSGNQEFHLFEAQVDGEPIPFDREEVLETRWFTLREVKRMALAEELLDGLSLTPLLFLCAREGW